MLDVSPHLIRSNSAGRGAGHASSVRGHLSRRPARCSSGSWRRWHRCAGARDLPWHGTLVAQLTWRIFCRHNTTRLNSASAGVPATAPHGRELHALGVCAVESFGINTAAAGAHTHCLLQQAPHNTTACGPLPRRAPGGGHVIDRFVRSTGHRQSRMLHKAAAFSAAARWAGARAAAIVRTRDRRRRCHHPAACTRQP
jgi:hypothetical protein